MTTLATLLGKKSYWAMNPMKFLNLALNSRHLLSLLTLLSLSSVGDLRSQSATVSAGGGICGGGTFFVDGPEGRSLGGAPNCFSYYANPLFGAGFEDGLGATLTVTPTNPLVNFDGVVARFPSGFPACYDGYINGVLASELAIAGIYSTYSFSLSLVKKLDVFRWSILKQNGRNQMTLDGSAMVAPVEEASKYTWIIAPGTDSLGCFLSSSGFVSGCERSGTLHVQGADSGGICFEMPLDVGECDDGCGGGSCGAPGGLGSTSVGVHSVDVKINLGWAVAGNKAGHLQIKEEYPSPLMATPQTLQFNYARAGVKKLTNNFGLRQVRTPDCLANVYTNTVNKYTIDLYSYTNVSYWNASSNLYDLVNTPFQTFTIENPGADTNKIRITQTREATDTIWEYAWVTNGWELTSGSGLRKETLSIAWSETNTLRTETRQIKNAGGTVLFQRIEKIRTNSVYGDRLLEEVTGTGVNALTNSFTWTTNGVLEQAIRSDGSWEFRRYDTNNRPTNVFSGFINQAVTTDMSLCRFLEHDYSTNLVSGSGDAGTLDSATPRRTIEYLLGQEIRRSYFTSTPTERREIQCVNPGAAWDNSSNLVTVTKLFTNGYYRLEPQSILRPDGTIEIFQLAPAQIFSAYATQTNVVLSGHPNDANGTNIDRGTKTQSVIDWKGNLLSKTVFDVPSGIMLSSESYKYDGYKRLTNTLYLDGTSASSIYKDCCNASFTIDREGTLTTNTLDSLQRILTSQRNGIILSNVYDAAGNIVSTIRIGTNNTAITVSTATFDDAGRQMSAADGLSNTTSYTNYVNGSGQTVKTTTYANASTRIETYNRDGSLASITGTAVHGIRNDYGVESESGTQRAFVKEIKLLDNGSDSSEWVKSYTDFAGRNYKMVYPDGASSQTSYNLVGQAVKQTDPDGVATLSQYNNLGELEFSALDVDANGVIDFAGTDRITQTVRDAAYVDSVNVLRTLTYAWQTNSSAVSNLLSESRVLTNGLRSWSIQFGLTNHSWTAYSGGHRYVTNTAPDGSYTLGDYQGGRLLSATRRTSAAAQLGASTNDYDPHGRLSLVTDARTGTTTNSFDNADRVTSVSTPAPASGQSPQVTTTTYNNMGWVTSFLQPDGASVSTVFHLTGEQATNSGARTYPVAYTYDFAGRLKTMTTWTNFASAAGAAVTTWNYDSQRGWLTGKVYADSQGPAYTYTAAARLSTRAWARGVTTTYGYNAGGDLATTIYSDTTPGVTNTFDRRGRTIQTVVGTSSTSSVIFNDAGLPLSEDFTVGPLSGLRLTNTYDSLLRRASVSLLSGVTLLTSSTNAYDVASRLSSVTFGTNSATYAYLTNSALVDTLTFKSGATTRMTTSNRFDNLNRLARKASQTGAVAVATFGYTYNAANQRTAITNADSSRWSYGYDTLGQVTSGKRYWSDGNIVAGQQFEYSFDDIGNRKTAASGGDEWGANLRYENYSANNLNQYTQRTVPGYVNVLGAATNFATVTVNLQPTYRKGEYFRAELSADNAGGPLWFGITNVAVLTNGGGPNIVTTNQGNLFLPKTAEAFTHDADGNLTNDGRWTYVWDGENRLLNMTVNASVPSGAKLKLDFTYDHRSRRTSKAVATWNGSSYIGQSTNKFGYDDWNLVGELNHTNGVIRSFAWGLDLSDTMQGAGGVGGLLSITLTNNGANFVGMDANGNVSSLVSATNGAVTATYEYSPFGELLRANGVAAKANPFHFSTKYQDEETDLLYYGFRYYNAILGRWNSRDPLDEAAGANLVGLVDNNPLNYVDTDGRQIFPPYQPPRPPVPPNPGLGDQFNPLGLRGTAGKTDYSQWFGTRFPLSVQGARDTLRKRIKEWIIKNCAKRPANAPGAQNGSEIQDVDIKPDMARFKDSPQNSYERNVQIGFFEFRTDPAQIEWTSKSSSGYFCYKTTMYVEEQTGADSMINGMFLFNKRLVRMGEWTIQGCGVCPCDKYAH